MFDKIILLSSIFIFLPKFSSSVASSVLSDSYMTGETTLINNEPTFIEIIKNVTVHAGREAILSCTVLNLDKYKVGWIRSEDQTILTLDTKVVTHNQRVGLTTDGVQTWNLHLRNVKKTDYGCYICQINTVVMKKQVGCIDVHVSPQIIDSDTSGDITVREGENASLTCKAMGHPNPKIMFKREDGEKIIQRVGFRDIYKAYENITGDVLSFYRVDRRQMGVFLCIAGNDVPPAVSKRIIMDVNFPPLIKIPSQLLGAPFGTDIQLECYVESSPRAFIYWTRNREMLIDGLGKISAFNRLNSSSKFSLEEKRKDFYKIYMRLTIRNFSKKDIGIYSCTATNSMGKAEASIRLYEIVKTNKVITTTSTENHIISVNPGYATPPYFGQTETGSRDRGNGPYSSNKEALWTTNGVSPKDKIISRDDTNTRQGGLKRRNNENSHSNVESGANSSLSPIVNNKSTFFIFKLNFPTLFFISLHFILFSHFDFSQFYTQSSKGSLRAINNFLTFLSS